MGTCSNCNRKTGIIRNYNPCEYERCKKEYCDACAKTHLQECPTYNDGKLYCEEHSDCNTHLDEEVEDDVRKRAKELAKQLYGTNDLEQLGRIQLTALYVIATQQILEKRREEK